MRDNDENPVIKVILFGKPSVFVNDVPVKFPFQQLEAMFYYLIVEERVSKAKIADIIWGEKIDEGRIAANMRNALYLIRKLFGKNFLQEGNKNHVVIGDAAIIVCDCNELVNSAKGEDLSPFKGHFLEDFYIKNNELYNQWVDDSEQNFKSILFEKLSESIEANYRGKNYDACQRDCLLSIGTNEYDELGYKYLIDIYRQRKEYSKAIVLYKQLEKALADDLFASPGGDIKKLMADIENERTLHIGELFRTKNKLSGLLKEQPFFVRKAELQYFSDRLRNFLIKESSTSIIVCGDEGIGKTALANATLENIVPNDDTAIIKAKCYLAEERYILKPWESVIEQIFGEIKHITDPQTDVCIQGLSRLFPFLSYREVKAGEYDQISSSKYEDVERDIVRYLTQISRQKRFVIYIDDLQWIDEISLSLIKNVMTTEQNNNITFIFTAREERHRYVDDFIHYMRQQGMLDVITLKPFTEGETEILAREFLPKELLSKVDTKALFLETEGNAFFITEILNHIKYGGSVKDITPNIRSLLKNRISSITNESTKILELIAMFFDGASFEALQAVSNKERYSLMEILEELFNLRLIKEETVMGKSIFTFTHQKMLEFVYNEMFSVKRKLLHEKIGQYYEELYNTDQKELTLYTKLMHHFDKAGNQKKVLKYAINYVYSHLSIAHEFYPVLNERVKEEDFDGSIKIAITDMQSVALTLESISEAIDANMVSDQDEESKLMLCDFYHMVGRHYIRTEEYKKGLGYIDLLKTLSGTMEEKYKKRYLINANRLLGCVQMNAYNYAGLEENIKEIKPLMMEPGNEENAMIWQRLEGMCYVMKGDYQEGIMLLEKALNSFITSPYQKRYLYNIAACYSWLGEAFRLQLNTLQAMKYYKKALDICKENNFIGGASTFYLYAGMAAFDNGDIEESLNYLTFALKFYDDAKLIWCLSLTHSYIAQHCFYQKDHQGCLAHIEKAWASAQLVENHYEQAVVVRICAQICQHAKTDKTLYKWYDGILQKDKEYYIKIAEKFLQNINAPVERRYLSKLKIN